MYAIFCAIPHHHQPLNVPTAGAQAFPMDGIGRLGHDPPRGPSADWRVLTTADATGTNGLTVWQCRSPTLHSWGRDRLAQLLGQLLGQLLPQHQHQQQRQQHPTRRSAGLPFMIQALVITELQVKGNPTCLHECMTTLLKLAHASTVPNCTGISTLNQLKSTHYEPNSHDDNNVSDSTETKHAEKSTLKQSKSTHFERNSDEDNIVSDKNEQNENTKRTGDESQAENASICMGSSVETRAHCMNILRALFRNSALEESVAGYVGEGLMVALEGFNKDTWMRNINCGGGFNLHLEIADNKDLAKDLF
ncbi:hypothetical protein evm_010814 [Chilo suppressalis]|nr:hypothetical protein evm_010814 [Chilo suppressalis]